MTTNDTLATIRTKIVGSPKVGGVAKPITTSAMKSTMGAAIVTNQTPNPGGV